MYYGFRRMKANDEYRLTDQAWAEPSSFERNKDRAEVAEAERRISGGDIHSPPI